jgi:hypothetical protein
MFGGLKKICFTGLFFRAGEAACRQGLRESSKAPLFNYIDQLEGLFYVNSAVLCICGLSYSLSCHRRVLNHLLRQDTWAKHTSLYLVANATGILNSSQYYPFR